MGDALYFSWVASCSRVEKVSPLGLRGRKEQIGMSAEQNKTLARRVVEELFNHDGNLDAADELFSSEYVCYVAGFEDLHGAQAVKHFAVTERQAIPDLKNTVEDQVAEADKVVTRYRTQGTHTGETEAFGPPTGNRIEIAGMVIDRLSGTKIAESWIVYDALGMMQQLGFIPEAGQQEAGS
jgi:predicted ester cyclase